MRQHLSNSFSSDAATTCAIMKPERALGPRPETRQPVVEVRIHQPVDAALANAGPSVVMAMAAESKGQRQRRAVEIAARENLPGVGEHQRVVRGGPVSVSTAVRTYASAPRTARVPAACSAGCRHPARVPRLAPRGDRRRFPPVSSEDAPRRPSARHGAAPRVCAGRRPRVSPGALGATWRPPHPPDLPHATRATAARPPTAVSACVPLSSARPSLASNRIGSIPASRSASRLGRRRPSYSTSPSR